VPLRSRLGFRSGGRPDGRPNRVFNHLAVLVGSTIGLLLSKVDYVRTGFRIVSRG
jgi:hypothetical protein